ncbi:MAG: GNAT family N-acetyltransferase [Paracoccus sp. (in: a-proteobacteria)]
MNIPGFATSRLFVRPWREVLIDPVSAASFEQALGTLLSPAVLEHLPPALQLNRDDGHEVIADWFAARIEESEVLIARADDGRLVGLILLAPDTDPAGVPAVHIGYLLSESFWGKGMATELVTGLTFALNERGPLRLIGGVGLDNGASAKVLRKAGFHKDDQLSSADTDIFVCDIPERARLYH